MKYIQKVNFHDAIPTDSKCGRRGAASEAQLVLTIHGNYRGAAVLEGARDPCPKLASSELQALNSNARLIAKQPPAFQILSGQVQIRLYPFRQIRNDFADENPLCNHLQTLVAMLLASFVNVVICQRNQAYEVV